MNLRTIISFFVAAVLAMGCSTSPTDPETTHASADVITADDVDSLQEGERLSLAAGQTYRFDATSAPIDYSRIDVRDGERSLPLTEFIDADTTAPGPGFQLTLGRFTSGEGTSGTGIRPSRQIAYALCLPIVACIFYPDGSYGGCRAISHCSRLYYQ